MPLAFLSAYGTTPGRVVAAPMNLEFVDPTSKVSLGHCEDMQAPTESSLYAYGSQSGMRKVAHRMRRAVSPAVAPPEPRIN